MKRFLALAIALTMMAPALARAQQIQVTPISARPSEVGAARYFTGAVVIDPIFAVMPSTRAAGAQVTFAPGARSAWHSHPAGQTLIVTSGLGWVQEWGGASRAIRAGDVIWTPPGVKHWHGASEGNGISHIAIQEAGNGEVVRWMEHVTDQQYRSAAGTR